MLVMHRVMLVVTAAQDPQGKGLFWAALNPSAQAAVSPALMPLQQNPSIRQTVPRLVTTLEGPSDQQKGAAENPNGFSGLEPRSKPSQTASQRCPGPSTPWCGAGGSAAVPPVLPSASRMIFTPPSSLGPREGTLQQCEWRGMAWWWRGKEDISLLLNPLKPLFQAPRQVCPAFAGNLQRANRHWGILLCRNQCPRCPWKLCCCQVHCPSSLLVPVLACCW